MTQAPAIDAPTGARRSPALGLACWIGVASVAAVLGLAIYGKIVHPFFAELPDGSSPPGPGAADWMIGLAEIGVIAGLAAFRRGWWAWTGVALMFAAFAGFSGHRLAIDAPCGCFGALTLLGVEMTGRVTLGLDLLGIALGLALASAISADVARRFTLLATALGGAAILGVAGSALTAPPTAADFEREHGEGPLATLFVQDRFDPIVGPESQDGPAWFVYVYNETCAICLSHLPEIEAYAEQRPEDNVLRVHLESMQDLERELDLPVYAWPSVPTALLMRDGEIVERYDPLTVPSPYEVRRDLAPDERIEEPRIAEETDEGADEQWPTPEHVDSLLRSVPALADVFDPESGTAPQQPTLLYLYSEGCPTCEKHLIEMRAFQQQFGGANPALRVRTISIEQIARDTGIEVWNWPTPPLTLLIKDGEVVERFGQDQTPSPFAILARQSG